MRTELRVLAIAGILVTGTACALFTQLAGPSATNTVRAASLAAMQTYHDSWQPLLAIYGGMSVCGSPAVPPCQDAKLYRKLYDADAAIATCSVAATAALSAVNPDMSGVSACLSQIGAQQSLIASTAVSK